MSPVPAPTAPAILPQAIMEVCLCHHLRRTARAMTRIFDEALQPAGLSAGQFTILAAVAARDITSAGEISSLLAMDRTTLSRNLKPLRQAGLLVTAGGAGRRPDQLSLTAAGMVALNQAGGLWQQAQGQITQRLGSGTAGLLLQSLDAADRAAR